MNDLLDLPEQPPQQPDGNDVNVPNASDFDLSDLNDTQVEIHIPDLPNLGWLKALNVSPAVYVAIVALVVGYTIYKKKKHGRISIPSIPHFGGNKYAPKGVLRPDWTAQTDVHKLSWGNTLDNGIAAVCPKTGDLYIAGGDGTAPDGQYHETAVIRCKRGNSPVDPGNYDTFWTGGGKCYGLTVLDNGDVIAIITDKGSMWDGAENWRFRNLTTGAKSDIIDDWFGVERAGQFAFLNGKQDSKAHIYFLSAYREEFKEFGGVANYVTVSRSKLEHPDRLDKHDFSRVSKVDGFVSPRKGSTTGWPYAVQIDVYRDGKGNILGAQGDYVVARVYRYKADKPKGPFERVAGHAGFGIPRHRYSIGRENYTAGVFTQSLFYFDDGHGPQYWVSMSGSNTSDGIYIARVH